MAVTTKHGHTTLNWKSRTYRSWDSMKQRCDNSNTPNFENYGGRGIKYDPSWSLFVNFLLDMGPRPAGTTLDRINVGGDYIWWNCRWSTVETQNRNTRTSKLVEYLGVTKTNQEWADELGMPPSTLYNRIFTRGWPVEKSMITPVRKKSKSLGYKQKTSLHTTSGESSYSV